MKKAAIIIAIVLGISFRSYAQGGLFGYGEVGDEEEEYYKAWYALGQEQDVEDNSLFRFLRNGNVPNLPNHGQDDNQNAPLGGGVLLLAGFGAAYALRKRRNRS